ncbi:MAG: ribonuclease R [Candidatus Hydrothermae bacterium]|nr:ribonuclease R [Candidatus Hydrothermae bacterium]
MEEIKQKVKKVLKRSKGGMTLNQILKRAGFRKRERKKALGVIYKMEEEGELLKVGKERYVLVDENVETGVFEKYPPGFGFLIREGQEDVFIPPHATHGAMDGDTVLVRIVREAPGKKPEGRVIRILKRAKNRYVGTIRRGRRGYYIEPDELTLPPRIAIIKKKSIKVKSGLKVTFEVIGGRAKIVDILGHEDDPSIDLRAVLSKYDLKEEFPKRVNKEIQQVEVLDDARDLTDKFIITIDPRDAKDFDDAISIEKKGQLYHLGVHIADVSSFVKEGGATDKEAFKRGTSVYLINYVVPMLPHRLSSDLCSLMPGQERFSMSVFMDIDSEGNVIRRRFMRSRIRSRVRLSYEDAQRIIENKPLEENTVSVFIGNSYEKIRPFLLQALELAKILRKKRQSRGSLDFDLPEPIIELQPTGEVLSVAPSVRLWSHRIIEEFMIKANETVAEFLEENEIPTIYRVHETPDRDKLKQFLRVVEGILDIKFDEDVEITREFLQNIITKAEERGHGTIVSYLLLRSMKRAKYSPNNVGHYGLASNSYLHFTSPIRRYPDLVVHRILKNVMDGKPKTSQEFVLKLEKIAIHSTKREEIAEKAEFDIIDFKKYGYMKEKVGDVFEGFVTKVTPHGFFVEIEEYLTEGFVSVDVIDEYLEYDSARKILVGKNLTIKPGQRLKVQVVAVDKWLKKMELVPYEEV